ncbi:alpha/beta hydrolase [Maribacter sp. 2304DJ31-5]|uniref:alpha/beta hydrolase n=1 Tax=Maribacter sp. 2304DJ31-5 TaxID=3386273 RepID=UPI0039BD10BF
MRIKLLLVVFFLCACAIPPEDERINGILTVPENRTDPKSRTLELVYTVLKAKNPKAGKAPILYLQGGPGGSTLFMERFWENHPLRNDRDIVLMDQRGTGASEANCKDSGDTFITILQQDFNPDDEFKALHTTLSRCKQTIKDNKVDLAGYNSRENAADFEALRKALGYKKWNLFGGSYGSRLGLTIMRDFPERVRSAILFSVFAPESYLYKSFTQNFENALFSVLERCEGNSDCNQRYPDLKNRLLRSLKNMEAEPITFDYKGSVFVLNTQDALLLLHQSLYNRNTIAAIPKFITALENGKTDVIIEALQNAAFTFNFVNMPMYLSVTAYEELPFNDETDFEKNLEQYSEIGVAPAFFGSDTRILESWHPYRATDFENQAVISEVPTLMASGGLDPITPVSNAKESLRHLKNGYEIVFENESHSLFNPCFFQTIEAFLDNPSERPNMDCALRRNPLQWD